jgi:hypothetical protein
VVVLTLTIDMLETAEKSLISWVLKPFPEVGSPSVIKNIDDYIIVFI